MHYLVYQLINTKYTTLMVLYISGCPIYKQHSYVLIFYGNYFIGKIKSLATHLGIQNLYSK